MKHLTLILLLSLLTTTPAVADWDAALEAREQAQRDAQQRQRHAEQKRVQQMKRDAESKANKAQMSQYRKELGAAARGKSDAEVLHLMEAKRKRITEEANNAAHRARNALGSGQGAASVKQVTGKTMQVLENMSDEEAEALARKMEKKHGK